MAEAARRGRPRDAEADRRIIETASELLLDRGYAAFSVDETAARAGVAKTTLYRRWPTKDHLVVAVVAGLQDRVPVEYSGDLRADMLRYFGAVAAGLDAVRRAGRPADGRSGGLVAEAAGAAARHPDIGAAVREMFARRNALVLDLFQQAVAHGELPPNTDTEVLLDQLAGSLYYRVLVTGAPVDDDYVRRLVTQTLGPDGPPVGPSDSPSYTRGDRP